MKRLRLNNNPDFEVKVFVLNHTGISLFVRLDEFDIDEASITIDLVQLPPLGASTHMAEIIEQGTAFFVKIYPNKKPDGEYFKSHRLIMKDEEVLEIMTVTEINNEKATMEITYTIKPKYTPPVTDDYPKM